MLVKNWGFCGPTAPEASVLFNSANCTNLIPYPGDEYAKSHLALYGRPGLAPFGTIAAPVRTLWAGNNRLFAIGGASVYELNSGGAVLTNYGAMAGATGDAVLIENGVQLLACDPGSGNIYNVAPGGGLVNVLHGVALEYLDGFYVAIASGASLNGANPNQINVSALSDGSTWDALNFVIRTGAADLCTQLAVLNGQLFIFGQKAIEVWYNAGNPLFPFARVQGATINLGLLSPATVVKFENTIIFVGSSHQGYAKVYRLNGLQPQRVSNQAIESYLQSDVGAPLLAQAVAYGYEEAGHTFYCLGTPGGSQVVYDLTTGLWHQRIYGAGVPQCAASLPNFNAVGGIYVGDQNGKVWFQSLGFPNDGTGHAITYTRRTPHVSEGNRWIKHRYLEIDADIGTAQIQLKYSNDGGRTIRTLARPDALKSASNDQGGIVGGPTGKRYRWDQLGRSRDRVYLVNISDDTNLVRLVDGYLDVEAGINGREEHSRA